MKYLAAYMLLVLGGNATPAKDDVSKLLADSGVDVDDKELSFLYEKLGEKSIDELIEEGKEKLVTIGGGGGGGGAAGGAGGDAAAAEEEEEEEEEEEVDVGGGGLFGGDDDG